jgi:hypothetical protein
MPKLKNFLNQLSKKNNYNLIFFNFFSLALTQPPITNSDILTIHDLFKMLWRDYECGVEYGVVYFGDGVVFTRK